MKASYSGGALVAGTIALLLLTANAAPVDPDEEQSENTLVARPDDGDFNLYDPMNTAVLRKLLLQLDADDRFGRVARSWPPAEPHGWGGRSLDGRLARPWRADKRQVRFRQCYFNPISCFRK